MARIALALSLILGFTAATSCKSHDTAAEMKLCNDCGVEKGTEDCCDENAMRCGDCGKIKGSEGCCK